MFLSLDRTRNATRFPHRVPRGRRVLRWLIVSQALFALSLPVWAVFCIGSFALDIHGLPWALPSGWVAAIWCYPAVSLGAIARSWLAFARRRPGAATLLTSVPLAYAVAVLLAVAARAAAQC